MLNHRLSVVVLLTLFGAGCHEEVALQTTQAASGIATGDSCLDWALRRRIKDSLTLEHREQNYYQIRDALYVCDYAWDGIACTHQTPVSSASISATTTYTCQLSRGDHQELMHFDLPTRPEPRFFIELSYLNTYADGQPLANLFTAPKARRTLDMAAEAWEQVIHDEFADTPAGTWIAFANPYDNGAPTPYQLPTDIDDVRVLMLIDGFDNQALIAQTFPLDAKSITQPTDDPNHPSEANPQQRKDLKAAIMTRLEGEAFQPIFSVIAFNADDDFTLAGEPARVGSKSLYTIALHELGHVLGFTAVPPAYRRMLDIYPSDDYWSLHGVHLTQALNAHKVAMGPTEVTGAESRVPLNGLAEERNDTLQNLADDERRTYLQDLVAQDPESYGRRLAHWNPFLRIDGITPIMTADSSELSREDSQAITGLEVALLRELGYNATLPADGFKTGFESTCGLADPKVTSLGEAHDGSTIVQATGVSSSSERHFTLAARDFRGPTANFPSELAPLKAGRNADFIVKLSGPAVWQGAITQLALSFACGGVAASVKCAETTRFDSDSTDCTATLSQRDAATIPTWTVGLSVQSCPLSFDTLTEQSGTLDIKVVGSEQVAACLAYQLDITAL